jgi:hypothetical protein
MNVRRVSLIAVLAVAFVSQLYAAQDHGCSGGRPSICDARRGLPIPEGNG